MTGPPTAIFNQEMPIPSTGTEIYASYDTSDADDPIGVISMLNGRWLWMFVPTVQQVQDDYDINQMANLVRLSIRVIRSHGIPISHWNYYGHDAVKLTVGHVQSA